MDLYKHPDLLGLSVELGMELSSVRVELSPKMPQQNDFTPGILLGNKKMQKRPLVRHTAIKVFFFFTVCSSWLTTTFDKAQWS